ncbi:MAG: hypothetical protein Phyf2KO_21870 [Phycisphaerales bacterium]
MHVRVDTTSLGALSSNSLVGSVWIEGECFSFPSDGWSDFVALVLEQWATELRPIYDRDGVARLRVFDGPDTMRIERTGDLLFVRISRPAEVDKELQSCASAITTLCESGRECCNRLLGVTGGLSVADRVKVKAARGCFGPQIWQG